MPEREQTRATPAATPAAPGRAERIRAAAAGAVRAALRRHMLLGEPVVAAGEGGGVRWLTPPEIRRSMAAAPNELPAA